MSYIYSDVDSLIATPPLPNVGRGECVDLVDKYARTPAPAKDTWKEGSQVRNNFLLRKGTAIATFVGGKYQSLKHGNHAALYYSQDAGAIYVVDQFRTSGGIRKRALRFKGKNPDGSYVTPSSNGDAFSVIE